jgi:putative membrane protein (TIGR04086 family)
MLLLTDSIIITRVLLSYTSPFDPDRLLIEREEMMVDKQVEGKRGLRWGLICLGAFAILVISYICLIASVLITMPLWVDSGEDWILVIVDIGIALICLSFGGFFVGRKAGYRGTLHGMLSTLIVGVAIIIWSAIGTWKEGVSFASIVYFIIGLFSPGLGALGGFWGERVSKS